MIASSILLRRLKEIREAFVSKGAVSAETAMTLEELGLGNRSLSRMMILRGHIVKVDDKYYLDVEKFDDRAVKQLQNFVLDLFDELAN